MVKAATAARRRRLTAAAFLAPFLVLFVVAMVAPVGYTIWMSLFREQSNGGLGFGGAERVFVGLDNYVRAVSDRGFRSGFANLAIYCVIYIPLMLGGALALALLLDTALVRARRFFQLALFLPHAVPGLIAAIIWLYLYTPGLSPIVDLLADGGLAWNFFDPDTVVISVVNMAAWQWTGYNVIIFYAALQAVPREVLEASAIDGAGSVTTALRVKVPMIRSAVVLTTLFTVVGSIQLFTEPRVVQLKAQGMDSAWSPVLYIYRAAFTEHDYGLAAAASLLLAGLAGGLSYAVTKFGNRTRKGALA
ncbi:sugar ABC transporter permease [Actinomadura fulvescens]|uniref:Sugar ABC transporter permease n=1 Tax=Actinomadura fulvescens TaxID=46160 RepID=A0ABN3QPP1_9ACTN